MKIDRKKVQEGIGIVTNAPATKQSEGYGFVQLEDGTPIYCGKKVVAKAGMRQEDVGETARVRYIQNAPNRYTALRAYVLRGADGTDQELADLLIEIDDRVQNVLDILEDRGCDVGETV